MKTKRFVKFAVLIALAVCWAGDGNSVFSGQSTTAASSVNPNLVTNGEFNNALNGWLTIGQGVNPYHPEDPGRAEFRIENGILDINIGNQGISIWSVMLYQSIVFEKGVSYTVSFDAKSDAEMQILSNITEDGTWVNLSGDQTFTLTGVMAHYAYQFTSNENKAALFQLCLGMAGTSKVSFDNIVITKEMNASAGGSIPSPEGFRLIGQYPNPFNASTRIDFELNEPAIVRMDLFNTTGQCIQILMDGGMNAGPHEVSWNGRDRHGRAVGSGMYGLRIWINGEAAGFLKLLLQK